ncbi:MAG: ATP-binding cassette subfamily F protein 3 [Candidatus Promineifilaceae bacterium]|jgi:ATP-binding cassette subfamily F protein 3
MPLLNVVNLELSFGEKDLFEELNLKIEPRDRIGLIGPNGVGKSSLLQVLSGLLEPDKGEIQRQKELTIGYLRQEAVTAFSGKDNTVMAEMISVFSMILEIESGMRLLEETMTAGDMSDLILSQYSQLQAEYEAAGGFEYRVDIEKVLNGLGFNSEEWDTPLNHLSGGQKTRVLLGRLLLEQPDLLILDEPTNHLDGEAVAWLEQTLNKWRGSLLIVSHDRYFLDKAVNRIWEMVNVSDIGTVTTYKGRYSDYVVQREAMRERKLAMFEMEKERLQKEFDFIRKHIAGGKHDMAKGKLRRLTRDIVLMEELGVGGMESKSWLEVGGRVRTLSPNEAAARLKQLVPPEMSPAKINVRLESESKSGELVFRTQRMTIGYAATELFTTEKIKLYRNECAAIIGPNGSGKSTLLKTVLGEIPPLRGTVEYDDSLQVGYFAQAHEQLKPENRVIDEILFRFPIGEQQARQHLAQYLFRGHDVFGTVADLSGGERGRLALAILSLEGANLLLLDEPTNHLDIPSQEILQTVLEQYDGTILLVSHDRYLVSRLASQVWEIKDGKLIITEGSYAEHTGKMNAKDGGKRGEKIDTTLAMPLPEKADLSWINDLVDPTVQVASPTATKSQAIFIDDYGVVDDEEEKEEGEAEAENPSRRKHPNAVRLEAYLKQLNDELDMMIQAGDEDEIAWLEDEIAGIKQELGGV